MKQLLVLVSMVGPFSVLLSAQSADSPLARYPWWQWALAAVFAISLVVLVALVIRWFVTFFLGTDTLAAELVETNRLLRLIHDNQLRETSALHEIADIVRNAPKS